MTDVGPQFEGPDTRRLATVAGALMQERAHVPLSVLFGRNAEGHVLPPLHTPPTTLAKRVEHIPHRLRGTVQAFWRSPRVSRPQRLLTQSGSGAQ